jgi:hypothetical protein
MTPPENYINPRLAHLHPNATPQIPHPPEPPPPNAKVVCVYQDPQKPDLSLTEHLLRATNPQPQPAIPEPEPAASDHPSKHARHSRKCKICNSPDREAIDQAYIHWVPPRRIVFDFTDVSSEVALYRHALATSLFSRRRGRFQHALDRIIEQAGDTRPTADAVLRAIRATSMLNEDGRWNEPARHVIIEHHIIHPAQTPALTPALLDASVPRDILEPTSDENLSLRERTPRSLTTTQKEAL